MLKLEILKKTELFGSLSDKELKALSAACVERKLKKGEIFFTAGDDSKGLYVIAKGSIRAYRENTDGREQVIHVERAVTTIAEVPVFDDRPYPSTVVAEEDCEVFFLSKENVRRFCMEYPAIALSALKLLAARLRKTAALVESLSLHEVDQRLASYLFQESVEKKAQKFKLPANTAIAARLGSVREVVSRAFTKLEKEGLITVNSAHEVTLLDIRGLRAWAGE